jgi:hypothetical protein
MDKERRIYLRICLLFISTIPNKYIVIPYIGDDNGKILIKGVKK